MIAEKNRIAGDDDARVAARIGHAGHGLLFDGGNERITVRRRGRVAGERGTVAGKRQFIHLRRVGGRVLPVHSFSTGRGRTICKAQLP